MSLIIALTICVSGAVEYVVFLRFRDEAVKKLKSCKDLIIIGITGSYGKTSVKNILYSILSKKYSVCMTPKSFNTPNGIVKTIREKLNYNNEIFICELGADKPNDIKKLTKILGENLKFGIITAVGKQHISGFKTIDKVYATKYQLAEAVYNNNGVMFFNTDNEYVLKMFKQYYGKKYSVSMDNLKSSLTYCSGYYLREDGSDFSAKINNRDLSFSTNLLGKHNILNALIAISVAKLFCVDYNDMNDAISELKPIPNRLELKTLANGARLIDNGFNSNPFSARKSLEVLSVYKNYKIVITPGFVELGNIQFDENFKYGAELSKIADEVWIVNNVNKNALKQGLLDNGFNLHNIKYFRKFNSEIVNSMQLYDKNTIFLIENDLPSSYK